MQVPFFYFIRLIAGIIIIVPNIPTIKRIIKILVTSFFISPPHNDYNIKFKKREYYKFN